MASSRFAADLDGLDREAERGDGPIVGARGEGQVCSPLPLPVPSPSPSPSPIVRSEWCGDTKTLLACGAREAVNDA